MVTSNSNSLCRQAEQYYYDFQNKGDIGLIPKNIIDHINECPYCREKMKTLETALSSEKSIKFENNLAVNAMTDLLKLHLAYIGNKVVCSTVKPFLPVILDSDLGIKIPTPITVHLDHCQPCAQDLETITGLNLSRIQSCRLSRLLANMTSKDTFSCSRARAAIKAVVSMDFHETNEQILNHLYKCSNCRKALYEQREKVITEYQGEKGIQECPTCQKLSMDDIFDYVVTFGLDSIKNLNASFENSFVQHLRQCPTGLAKIQELHNTIFQIAERPESRVATIYKMNEYAETKETEEPDNLYSGFPISVEIENREDKEDPQHQVSTIKFSNTLKRKIAALSTNHLFRTGAIGVAVLLMAIAFFFRTTMAEAVTLDKIYTAIDNVQNVYTSTFVPDKPEPIQERWISRTLNVFMTKTEETLVFFDIKNKVRKIKQAGIDSIQTSQISDSMIADIEQNLSDFLGLVPFQYIDTLPKSEWKHIINDEQGTSTTNVEVYELTWLEEGYGGPAAYKKWRLFIDPVTNLPQKTETYRKYTTDGKYILQSTIKLEYLNESEMRKDIENFSYKIELFYFGDQIRSRFL